MGDDRINLYSLTNPGTCWFELNIRLDFVLASNYKLTYKYKRYTNDTRLHFKQSSLYSIFPVSWVWIASNEGIDCWSKST